MPLDSVRRKLIDKGLLGHDAATHGGPDELMLVSSGPTSHLSRFSLLCGPSKKRVLIRQPSRTVLPVAQTHSPLSGDIQLREGVEFTFQKQFWDGSNWKLEQIISSNSLADGLRKLCTSGMSSFLHTTNDEKPFIKPFWAGALSYDLLQMTQPIRLQHPPEEDELLCIFWEIQNCVVHNKKSDKLTVLSNDSSWWEAVEQCLEGTPFDYERTLLKVSEGAKTNCSDLEHEEIVKAVQSSIIDGQLYQLNYGRTWEGEVASEPWDLFCHSIATNPAPYSGFLHMKDESFALI